MSGGRRIFAALLAVGLSAAGLARAGDIKTHRLSMNGADPAAFAAAAAVEGGAQQARAEGNGASGLSRPSVSADGRFVAFDSEATNLERPGALGGVPVVADTNGVADIFIHDTYTRLVRRVMGLLGAQPNGASRNPSLSPDGRFIAFESDAKNLVGGDANGTTDVFVHDLRIGTTTLVSRAHFGGSGNGPSRAPAFSRSGNIAFESDATNIAQTPQGRILDDTNGVTDVFVVAPGEALARVVLVSRGIGGVPANGPSTAPAVGDGAIAFASRASNLVAGDTNGAQDVFVVENHIDAPIVLVSAAGDVPANRDNGSPAIDERAGEPVLVAFESDATNLAPGDDNGTTDVFVRAASGGQVTLVSRGADGHSAPGASRDAAVTAGMVAFTSDGYDRQPGTPGVRGVYVANLTTGAVQAVSGGDATGMAPDGASYAPAISASGLMIAYASDASTLVADDTNGVRDVFARLDETRCANGATEDGPASGPLHGAEPGLSRGETLAHIVGCELAARGL